jgi:hypothetical protein
MKRLVVFARVLVIIHHDISNEWVITKRSFLGHSFSVKSNQVLYFMRIEGRRIAMTE